MFKPTVIVGGGLSYLSRIWYSLIYHPYCCSAAVELDSIWKCVGINSQQRLGDGSYRVLLAYNWLCGQQSVPIRWARN